MENTIYIGNELNINNACKIKSEIESIMMKHDTIILISDNISNFDLAGLQLLIATKNQSQKLNKKIKFEITFEKKIKELLNKVGFDLVEL